MKKRALRIFITAGVCFLAAAFAKDPVIKQGVSFTAAQITGTRVSIGGFSLGVFKPSIRIANFKMYSPKGFSGVMLDLPKAAVDYNLFSIIKGKPHLLRLDVELKEICLQKDKEGRLNVDELKIARGGEAKEGKRKAPAKPLAMRIDLFNLHIGRLVYKEYTEAAEPVVKVYDINLDKSYTNITSAQQLTALILLEPMKQAGIKGAKIYGIGLLFGIGALPASAILKIAGNDTARQDFDIGRDKSYELSLRVLKGSGKVKKEDRALGVISADVNGVDVTLKLKPLSGRSTQITVSARQFMMPKPEIAAGILYRISEELKK